MRAFAITGMVTTALMPSIISGSLMRATPPSRRMSAGTRSSAMTATAPASSAIFAWSGVTTSMITPPLSISAIPRFTRTPPVPAAAPGLEGVEAPEAGGVCATRGSCVSNSLISPATPKRIAGLFDCQFTRSARRLGGIELDVGRSLRPAIQMEQAHHAAPAQRQQVAHRIVVELPGEHHLAGEDRQLLHTGHLGSCPQLTGERTLDG